MKFSPTILATMVCLILAAPSVKADATLRAGDTFELRIGGVPPTEVTAVNGTYTIDGNGYLSLPLINERKIKASGCTQSQIETAAAAAYVQAGIYTHPTNTLTIAPAMRYVNVSGQVKAPQRVAYTPDMTVLSAINAAGDFTDFADQRKVRLIRDGKVNFINCSSVRKDPSLDMKVLPGDQVMVPQGWW